MKKWVLFTVLLILGSMPAAFAQTLPGALPASQSITDAPFLTAYASGFGISLLLFGLGLIALEIFVVPGFGATGISGMILLLLGVAVTWMTFDSSHLPTLTYTYDDLQHIIIAVLVAAILSFIFWFWLSRYLPSLPYFNRMVLQTTVGSMQESKDPALEAAELAWPQVNTRGSAVTDLRPGGVGRFYDDLVNDQRNIDVLCDHGFVSAGQEIIVRKREGKVVVVRQAEA